jgi:phage tail-like protein
MPNGPNDTRVQPFTSFNFAIEIDASESPGLSPKLCNAAFAECDGLEMNMEVKTLREGGNNGVQVRLAGPLTFGTLTLKRGLTSSFDLWDWFDDIIANPKRRANAQVILYAADGQTVKAAFILTRCLPIKLKAPALNAKDGTIAIEELQIAYESLRLKKPGS